MNNTYFFIKLFLYQCVNEKNIKFAPDKNTIVYYLILFKMKL